MKLGVSFLFTLLFFIGQGQSSNNTLDSLINVRNTAKEDTTRLKAEFQIGMTKPIFRPEYWDSLSKVAHKLSRTSLRARGIFNKAYSLTRLAKYRESIPIYEESYELYSPLKDYDQMSTILTNLGYTYKKLGEKDKTMGMYRKSIQLRMEIDDTAGVGLTYNNIGSYYQGEGKTDSAIYYLQKGIAAMKNIQGKKGKNNLALAHSNLGAIMGSQGNIELALFHLTKSIEIHESIGGGIYAIHNYRYLATLYQTQEDYESALKYYRIALEKARQNQFIDKEAENLHDIGVMHQKMKNYKLADSLFNKSLTVYTDTKDPQGQALVLNSYGTLHLINGDTTKARAAFEEAINISRKLNEKTTLASALLHLAELELKQNNISSAKKLGEEGLNYAQETKRLSHIKLGAEVLDDVYAKGGQWKDAHKMSKLYIEINDSLENLNNERLLSRQRIQYEYDIKAHDDSLKTLATVRLKNSEIKARDARLKEESTKQKALFGIIALFVIITVIAIRSYQIKKRDNKIIAEQKDKVEFQNTLLEEKNREITDSINYAKRIQTAILPPKRIVKEFLNESFILYRPKDIVAGDFYWLETTGNKIHFAACDCTGHGVPGALVSVICNNGLNRAVKDFNLTEPGQILDKAREIVVQEFEKSEEEVKDGMDVALCTLDGKKLSYAGANNPLWIIRKDSETIEEIKADKQPIGHYENPKPYSTHHIDLHKGDTIYIFSDGFADQFGGAKGKKFKASNFKKLLLSIQSKSMEEQYKEINLAFENWMSDYEQLDDVCVIGVKV